MEPLLLERAAADCLARWHDLCYRVARHSLPSRECHRLRAEIDRVLDIRQAATTQVAPFAIRSELPFC